MLLARIAAAWALLAVSADGEIIPLRSFTTAEGLAHDHVSRVFRDSRDFLWICTDDGLSRFDGRQFINYTVASGLPHMHVNDILETRSGDYWVATDGGAVLFSPAAGQRIAGVYRPPGTAESLFVNGIAAEGEDAVLLATSAGLFRIRSAGDRRHIEPIDVPSPGGPVSAHTIRVDRGGNLWVGASNGLYCRNRGGTWIRFTTEDGLPHNYVGSLVADPEGRVWACTRMGLARLSNTPRQGARVAEFTLTDTDGLPHKDVRDVLFSTDGSRWIATLGGLVEWREPASKAARFRTYDERHGLTDREVYALAEDPAGNLWIGTRRGGLMRLSRTGFETFDKADGLAFSGTDALVRTASGYVCVAGITDPRRIIRCPDGRGFRDIILRLPPDLHASSHGTESSTLQDHLGAWWVSTGQEVVRFRGDTPNLRLLSGRDCRRLYEDSSGNIWITAQTFGTYSLLRWNRSTGTIDDLSGILPPAARQRNTNAILETSPGTIWIALTRPGGLFRLRAGRFEEIPGVPPGRISSLYCDSAKRLWIATLENGVGVIERPEIDRPAIHFFRTAEGLSSNEAWTVVDNGQRHIYVGTARGVDRLDPATGIVENFSATHGLARGDIRAAARDHDGNLWFLSNRGLSRLRPPSPRAGKAPVTRITALRLAGLPHPLSEIGETTVGPLDLPFQRNTIEIQYAAIDYGSLEQVRYRYRLAGSTQEWSEPTTNALVQFPNLPPGHYRFEVRALQSSAPAVVTFHIAPPYWKRTWFLTLVAAAVGSLLFFWHRVRLGRQLELERVRLRIAADLHDDVAASLSRTAMLSETLKLRMNGSDGDSQRILSDIADNSRSMIESMSDIVWSIDPRHDNLSDLVTRLRAFGFSVLEPCGIHWSFEVGEDALEEKLSADQRRQMFLILKEAIHNIARHSRGTNASVRISVEHQWLVAEITDDGCGCAGNRCSGLGIQSMRARAAHLRGTFDIVPNPGGGTRASLRFPLGIRKSMNMRLRQERSRG
jgi:ligand-binding sensor domain-containing protein/signal transduction histidine kinase